MALIIVAGGVGIWYLEFNLLSSEKEELEKVKKQVKSAKAKKKGLKKLKETLETLDKKLADLIKRIPDFDLAEYDGFINNIEEMRRQSNIFIKSATYTKPTKTAPKRGGVQEKIIPPDVHRADYDLVCQGGFYTLLRFINLMETQQRFMEIKSLTLTAPKRRIRIGPPILLRELNMKVTTYTFRIPDQLPPEEEEPEEIITTTPLPE